MAKAVGLQIDAHAIKALVLSGKDKDAKIVNFFVEKLDAAGEGKDLTIVEKLENLFSKNGLPRGNVVASVRALDAVMREVNVPFVDDLQIEQTIKYQAERHFHGVSIDDLIVQFSKYEQSENNSRLFVSGLKKGFVERRLGLLEEIQVDPVSVDMDVAALANAFSAAGVANEHKLVVLVDMEANNLRIAILENGKLRSARSIRKRFGDKKKKAEDDGSERLPVVILEDGDPEESFSLEDSGITNIDRDSYLTGVFREIDKTIALCNSDESVDFICVTGAASILPGIEDAFEDYFEVEARKIDFDKFFPGRSPSAPDVSLNGTIPLGLALKGLGFDSFGMDFRQEEFTYQGKFEKLKYGLACALCLTFVLCFLIAFDLKQELRVKRDRLEGMRRMQQDLFTIMFPAVNDPSVETNHKTPLVAFNPRFPSKTDWFRALNKEFERLEGQFGSGLSKSAIKRSGLDILGEFAQRKATVRNKQIVITSALINQDQTRIHCLSDARDANIPLLRKLNESTNFEARAERIRTVKEGGFEFDIVLKLKEKKE